MREYEPTCQAAGGDSRRPPLLALRVIFEKHSEVMVCDSDLNCNYFQMM